MRIKTGFACSEIKNARAGKVTDFPSGRVNDTNDRISSGTVSETQILLRI
jgi:hypothetical protein